MFSVVEPCQLMDPTTHSLHGVELYTVHISRVVIRRRLRVMSPEWEEGSPDRNQEIWRETQKKKRGRQRPSLMMTTLSW